MHAVSDTNGNNGNHEILLIHMDTIKIYFSGSETGISVEN